MKRVDHLGIIKTLLPIIRPLDETHVTKGLLVRRDKIDPAALDITATDRRILVSVHVRNPAWYGPTRPLRTGWYYVARSENPDGSPFIPPGHARASTLDATWAKGHGVVLRQPLPSGTDLDAWEDLFWPEGKPPGWGQMTVSPPVLEIAWVTLARLSRLVGVEHFPCTMLITKPLEPLTLEGTLSARGGVTLRVRVVMMPCRTE